MMQRKDKAAEVFTAGLTCSQAVAVAFAGEYGLDPDVVLKLSRGFGGGMGGLGGQCGAVSGAVMVLGLGYDPADPVSKTRVYQDVKLFMRKFHERHQQIDCYDLLGCDTSTEAGKALMQERSLRETRCTLFVKDAVEIVEEILACR